MGQLIDLIYKCQFRQLGCYARLASPTDSSATWWFSSAMTTLHCWTTLLDDTKNFILTYKETLFSSYWCYTWILVTQYSIYSYTYSYVFISFSHNDIIPNLGTQKDGPSSLNHQDPNGQIRLRMANNKATNTIRFRYHYDKLPRLSSDQPTTSFLLDQDHW